MAMGDEVRDLIKTIEDGDDVPDYSDNSDEEVEFQPSKMKSKLKKESAFDSNFEFANTVAEYNHDSWNDVMKYVKRKAKTKTDDKISLARKGKKKEMANEEIKVDSDSDISNKYEDEESDAELSLSEDEFAKDGIKIRKHKGRKAEVKEDVIAIEDEDVNKDFFEDAPPFDENVSFYQMNLSRPLLKAIAALNYTHPTPIQAATVPVALLGRDVCGCAATGTGKTAAYMLPTLERLLYRPMNTACTRVLVLVPTRELGVQVYQVTRQLAQFTSVEVGLSVGGLDLKVQESVLRKNPDIVIATPGRLIDHIQNTPTFSLHNIEVLILDEADRMLDAHFAEQMKMIVRECARTRQTLLFSATMTETVEDLVSVSLSKPIRIFVDNNKDVALNLRQEFVRIRSDREADREPLLAALICRTFHDHTMVFVQTKKQAHRLHILLGLFGIKVGELHGNMTQPQRMEALNKFKNEELAVLVATDVAARGLDIRGVKTVINFTLPATLEHYIHRVGRTARAGRSGVSVSLAGENERKIVKEVTKKARNPVKLRVIPPDIIVKWRTRVQGLEKDIKNILQEEWEERTLQRAENQANKVEKMLKGQVDEQRLWFQTDKDRKDEKTKFMLSEPKKGKGDKRVRNEDMDDIGKTTRGKRGRRRGPQESAEDRMQEELGKVAALQARLTKRKSRPKKIRIMADFPDNKRNGGSQKRKSSFAEDLTDTSRKGTKRLRYDANVKQNEDRRGKKPGGFTGPKKGAPKKSGKMSGGKGGKKGKGNKRG